MISVIMGGGKAMFGAELAATVELGKGEVCVVTTSSQKLVRDLRRDIKARVKDARSVGMWYTHTKRLGNVIVACIPSVPALAEKLKKRGIRVKFWLADEAHKTECDTIIDSNEALNPMYALGMTATAFRSDKKQSISLFGKCIYRYGVKEALDDGVIVPWRIINWQAGEAELDEACLQMAISAEGPGLVNALTIEDAEVFARFLTDHDVPAAAVHSKKKPGEIEKILRELEMGRYKCVIHVNLLTEGANFPWLKWLILRREVEARVRFIQEIGRLLRSHPGKDEAVFYDPHDLFGNFKLTYEEALGEVPHDPKEIIEREGVGGAGLFIKESDPPMAMQWIESTVRTLVVACEASGFPVRRKLLKKAERVKP